MKLVVQQLRLVLFFFFLFFSSKAFWPLYYYAIARTHERKHAQWKQWRLPSATRVAAASHGTNGVVGVTGGAAGYRVGGGVSVAAAAVAPPCVRADVRPIRRVSVVGDVRFYSIAIECTFTV